MLETMHYYCEDCNFRFDKSATYFNHRRRRHPKFPCLDCGKVFGLRKKLAYHMRGCGETRKNKISQESAGSVISCSNYKRLPIVTAKELDIEFEIYMSRKFGKKGIFRNRKMCKFCNETFLMASDFADHIRGHYKSITLDATGVKSKFDFMHFMGLKIRETNEADCCDTEAVMDKVEHKMAECRVVIIGERCKICSESFKCRTDLDEHKKIHHPVKKRNEIILVLKIGEEVISRISLKRRHIRRGAKIGYRSSCKQLKNRLRRINDTSKYSPDVEGKYRVTESAQSVRKSTLNNRSNQDFELLKETRNVPSVGPSKTGKRRAFSLQKEINYTDGNTIRCGKVARGRKEIAERELDNLDDARENHFGHQDSSYDTKLRSFELESGRIYADEFFESMQFSEPWKDEFAKGNGSWCSDVKSERNDPATDEESYYCMEKIGSTLTPKERNLWEQEHYDNLLNDEEGGSFHESPPIYKYSCDPKYQADFSFPSEEKSYGFQVKSTDNEETNNNETDSNRNINDSYTFGYKGTITVKDKNANLKSNNHRSGIYECENNELFGSQDFQTGRAAVNKIDEYQRVLIKEEVMLEDLYLLHQ